MRLTTSSRVLFGCFTVLVVAACSSGSQLVASKYVKTATIGAAGGTISIEASDDATLAGTSIVIPANAVSKNTTISIGLTSGVTVAPKGTKAAGPVLDFEPSGTVFAIPATVTMPVTVAAGTKASSVFVEAVESDGSESQLSVQSIAGGLATFQVKGFTNFGAWTGGGEACSTNTDCASGTVCVNGACSALNSDASVDSSTDSGTDATPSACSNDSDCPNGSVCVDAVCTVTVTFDASTDSAADATICASGEVDCNGTCADINSDSANCGACAFACATGVACVDGRCDGPIADAGTDASDDAADDAIAPSGDAAVGGNCTNDSECANGLVCVAGRCAS